MDNNKSKNKASNLLNSLISGRISDEQKRNLKKLKYEQGDLVVNELMSDSQSSDSENEQQHPSEFQLPTTRKHNSNAINNQSKKDNNNFLILNSNNQTMIIDEDYDLENNENVDQQQQPQQKQNLKDKNWDSSLPFRYMNGDISFNELTSIMENNFTLTTNNYPTTSTSKVVIEEATDSEEIDEEEDDEEEDDFMSSDDNLMDQESRFKSAEEFVNQLQAKEGKSMNLGKGSGGGRRKKLAKDLLGLVGQANLHFVRGDHNGAINMCMEVIRLAPTAPEPFQTLSLIYEEKRQFEKAYQYGLISAYLNPSDGDNWIKVAEMAIELKNYAQAIICYNKAIKIYPKNLSLYQDRCKLYRLNDDNKKALEAYENLYLMIQKEQQTAQTHEMALQVAKEIAMLHYFNNNLELSIKVLEDNLKKYKNSIMNEDVNLYLEILISNNQFVCALNTFKKYCGIIIKLDGNLIEELTDDLIDNHRIEIELNYSELQIDLRSKLCVCLINLKIFNCVNKLKEFITEDNAEEMGDLYLDIADAYIKINHYKDAEPLLKLLVNSKAYNCSSIWLKYARILKKLEKYELSINAYKQVLKQTPKSVEAKLELTNILIKLDRIEDAEETTGQLNDNTNKLNLDLLLLRCNLFFKQKRYEEFINTGRILLTSEFTFLVNESEMFIMISSTTTKSRLENLKELYRDQSDRLDLSELTNNNNYEFVGNLLTEDDLIDIFSKYCCALYETKNYKELIRMVFSSYTSDLYTNKSEYYDYLALNSCYLTKNTEFLYRLSKMLITKYIDNNQLWNFFSAIMLNIYQDFRHNRFCMRLSLRNQNSIPLSFINGHNALASGNYKVAMTEYIHIFKQNLTDEFAILCILIVFTHLSCQKFVMNRNVVVAQLCAFMKLYLEIRGISKESLYNVGRSFHQLGLENEAIHYYKTALDLEDKIECDMNEKEQIFNLNCEIAFNLSLIYQNSGNREMALYYTNKYFIV